jgi:predicted nucleotidyltransferase
VEVGVRTWGATRRTAGILRPARQARHNPLVALRDPSILNHTLSPSERLVLDAFAARVKARFGDRLERIAVFGSRARGDLGAWSDIDVIVVLKVPAAEETAADRLVRELLAEASQLAPAEHVPISLVVESHERFARTLARERRFALDVEREGIRL